MNLYIKNTYGNRPATSYDMAEYLLGSRKAKMPAKGREHERLDHELPHEALPRGT